MIGRWLELAKNIEILICFTFAEQPQAWINVIIDSDYSSDWWGPNLVSTGTVYHHPVLISLFNLDKDTEEEYNTEIDTFVMPSRPLNPHTQCSLAGLCFISKEYYLCSLRITQHEVPYSTG